MNHSRCAGDIRVMGIVLPLHRALLALGIRYGLKRPSALATMTTEEWAGRPVELTTDGTVNRLAG